MCSFRSRRHTKTLCLYALRYINTPKLWTYCVPLTHDYESTFLPAHEHVTTHSPTHEYVTSSFSTQEHLITSPHTHEHVTTPSHTYEHVTIILHTHDCLATFSSTHEQRFERFFRRDSRRFESHTNVCGLNLDQGWRTTSSEAVDGLVLAPRH